MMNFTRLAGSVLLATASIAATAAPSAAKATTLRQELKGSSLFERISKIRHQQLDREIAAKGFGTMKSEPIVAEGMERFGDFG